MCEEFTCQFCNKVFKKHCAVAIHERTCKQNPNKIPLTNHKCNFPHITKEGGWTCNICGTVFQTRAEHNKHKTTSHADHQYVQVHPKLLFECVHCHKQWETTIEGFKTHEKYCIENPNRVIPKSHPVSEDVKKRISEKQKENYKGKSRFNIDRSQEPYSEKYFREWLNKENIEYKKNFHVDRFFLDFAFPDKKLYFEVNGEQHYRKMYNGRDYQERDRERADILSNLGWNCIATIRWSEFRALQSNERSVALDKLRYAIQNSTVVDFNFSYTIDVKYKRVVKRKHTIKQDKVNNLCTVRNTKITDEEMNIRKEVILNSGVDLSKFGWVEKVSKVTGLTRRQIYKIVNSTDLLNCVYRR